MKTIVVHRRDDNVGDIGSNPSLYFGLGDVKSFDIMRGDLSHIAKADVDVIIIGGGGILYPAWNHRIHFIVTRSRAPVVFWGAGMNQGNEKARTVPVFAKRAALVGLRDTDIPSWSEWVPCASCMASCFDSIPDPTHPVVIYDNWHRKVPINADVPRGCNHGFDGMADAVEFLAQGETVITTSYHGAYWAVLLGRKTVVVPWVPKMLHMKHQPGILPDKGGIADARAVGLSYPNALAECRWANQTFERRVKRLVRGGS